MTPRRIIRAINWIFFGIVIATPLFYWKWSLYPYTVSKTALFEALIELAFALWVILAVLDKRYRPRMTPLAWAILAYLGILTVTAFTGVDPWRSFFSDLERAFGIVMYYHLAVLALMASALYREIPWKKLWYASFVTSLITVGIAIIQLKLPNLLLANDAAAGRPGATFGNPTFLAGYLLFNIFLAAYFAISEKKDLLFLWATIIFGVIGVFITETRGDIFGLFAGIFAIIILFAFRAPATSSRVLSKRSFYVLLLAILVIVSGGIWLTRGSAAWDHVPGIDRLKDLTLSGANSDIIPRTIALNAAWKGFLDRPIAGWGFENFNVVFNKYYDPKVLEYGYAESNFDKPHDIVMEELDAGGVFLLLAYLGMLIVGVYESWKVRDSSKAQGLLLGQFILAAIIAYFVRSLVIFDTIGPALMLFLLFGWVDGQYRVGIDRQKQTVQQAAGAKNRGGGGNTGGERKVQGWMLAVALVVAAGVMYTLNGTAFAAGYLAWEGHENLQILDDPSAGLIDFQQEATTWNVYQWDFIRDYANTVAEAYFYDESTIPQVDVQNAITLMNQVTLAHPNDAYNHYLLTDIYNLASDIDPKDYLAAAEQQAQIAFQLSPNRQEIYFYLMKTKSLEGDNAGALALAKTALALDPNVADSHFYYGMLAFATGDNVTGYNEVETAMQMGREWTDYNEPEVAGDYFADSGHIPDAITLYQDALALKPGDLNIETKLGAAYYLTGNDALAKQYLSDVASRFDFTTSPAYAQYKPILDALGIQQ